MLECGLSPMNIYNSFLGGKMQVDKLGTKGRKGENKSMARVNASTTFWSNG